MSCCGAQLLRLLKLVLAQVCCLGTANTLLIGSHNLMVPIRLLLRALRLPADSHEPLGWVGHWDGSVFCLACSCCAMEVSWVVGLQQGEDTGLGRRKTGKKRGSNVNRRWSLPFGFGRCFERRLGFGGARSCIRLLVWCRTICRDPVGYSYHLSPGWWWSRLKFTFDLFLNCAFANFKMD